MRRLVSLPVIAIVLVGAALAAGASGGGSGVLKTYEIELDNAFGLVKGGDLKIGGVKAGQAAGFRLTEREPYRTIVTVEITEPGFDSLRTDARCDVRQQSLIGEYFLDCDLGRAKQELKDGGRIPVARTSSTIPPDLINNVMRRPYRERFRLILSELGTGLAGRPEELNEVIRRAHPALRELSQTIGILRSQNKVIRDFIRDADTVSAAVEPFKEEVARWAREANDTAVIQASRSEQLGRYWNRLPDFLAELRPTLAELEKTADEQIPTLRALGGAAPELERFLRSAAPFARETRGSISALGGAAVTGNEALRESKEEVRQLRRLAVNAPRLGKPLRQFLQAIDDRKRSIENDPAAAPLAPPAPDKTAYQKGRGFTGMEALMNYFYYQTLAINSFDELSHVLRIILFNQGPCIPYESNPTKAEIDECNSWLGPNQPGVTTGDPTATRTATAKRAAPRAGGQERAAEEPTTPRSPDNKAPGGVSKPRTLIPDDVKDLLERLGKPVPKELPQLPGGAGGVGGSGGDTPTALLDYLLGP
jgi:ABC-type transporter Mla subunit MlaD